MRRTASIIVVSAVAALAATSAPALAAVPGKTRVTVPVCHSDIAPLDRRITWVGEMSSRKPGDRMEMRFDVYMRTPTDPTWRLVSAPDLGIWNRAKAGTTAYKFRQKAVNLAAPASYKARVTFRWLGPKGDKVVKSRTSKVCEQSDPRPNLRVVRLDATPLKGGQANYQVVVRNVGGSAASGPNGFDVALAVDGVTQAPNKNVLGLRAGESVQVNFRGARCTQGRTVRAAADPDARIDQSDRADDVLELPCPASLSR